MIILGKKEYRPIMSMSEPAPESKTVEETLEYAEPEPCHAVGSGIDDGQDSIYYGSADDRWENKK